MQFVQEHLQKTALGLGNIRNLSLASDLRLLISVNITTLKISHGGALEAGNI
jgi:hypothetical protein